MEKRIRDRYTDEIKQEAMKRYCIAEGDIELLDGFESYIFKYRRDEEDYILRIGHSIRRSPSLIRGEIDWINYLARGGASVAKAVASLEGQFVEELDDLHGGQFLATAFVRAEGKPPWEQPNSETPDFYEHYGRVIGRMHKLTQTYQPPDPTWRRLEWDDPINWEISEWLPKGDGIVLERYSSLKAHFDTLPRDDTSAYGLIHQDAHRGNMFLDDSGKITLFDFDDCVYSWFIYDIAMVLFYAANGQEDMSGYTENFMKHFLRGYREENRLDARWLKETPHFLKLREIDLYALIHRSFDVENLDNAWCARFMNGRREKIVNETPFIEFEWDSLAEYV